jgi:GNAT superfamily N-acetyltransferase
MHRAVVSLRHRGLPASARLAFEKVRRIGGYSAVSLWYELALQGDRPRRSLPHGLELSATGPDEIGLLEQIPVDPAVARLDAARARSRLDQGATLWVVTKGDQVAFACWTFLEAMPMQEARDGTLALPAGVVCLEDSVSSPAFRGQGIAPAAWGTIADRLAAGGYRAMVTKVGEENAASRRAVEKAGFREVARMHVGRRGRSSHLRMQIPPGSPYAWLRSIETS